jgi:hypothetical protein
MALLSLLAPLTLFANTHHSLVNRDSYWYLYNGTASSQTLGGKTLPQACAEVGVHVQ